MGEYQLSSHHELLQGSQLSVGGGTLPVSSTEQRARSSWSGARTAPASYCKNTCSDSGWKNFIFCWAWTRSYRGCQEYFLRIWSGSYWSYKLYYFWTRSNKCCQNCKLGIFKSVLILCPVWFVCIPADLLCGVLSPALYCCCCCSGSECQRCCQLQADICCCCHQLCYCFFCRGKGCTKCQAFYQCPV